MDTSKTFTDRLQARMRLTRGDDWLPDGHPWRGTTMSKLRLKEVVASLGVPFPKTLWTGDRLERLPDGLPAWFVLKAERGDTSQQVLVIDGGLERLRYRRAMSPEEIVAIANGWRRGRLLIEALVDDVHGRVPPRDYKCYAFGAYVAMITVFDRTEPRLRWGRRLPDWTRIPVDPCDDSLPLEDLPEPACLRVMVEYASRLGLAYGGFLRADFYVTSLGPVLGEICPWPNAGAAHAYPPEINRWLGDQWLTYCGETP